MGEEKGVYPLFLGKSEDVVCFVLVIDFIVFKSVQVIRFKADREAIIYAFYSLCAILARRHHFTTDETERAMKKRVLAQIGR